MGTLQRIHRQYVRYESALDDTLIGIEHLNSGYLMHRILDPKILAKYLESIEDEDQRNSTRNLNRYLQMYISIMVIH